MAVDQRHHLHDQHLDAASSGAGQTDAGTQNAGAGPGPLRRALRRVYKSCSPARFAWEAGKTAAIGAEVANRSWARRLATLLLPSSGTSDTLFLFYDLWAMPATYDVATVLALAELERRRRKLDAIHMVVVPGAWRWAEETGFGAATGTEDQDLRAHALILPLARLLPSCRGVTMCASREEAVWLRFAVARHVFPDAYTPSIPSRPPEFSLVRAPDLTAATFFPMFRACAAEARAIAEFLANRIGHRHAIVVTLRQYDFMPDRNSRVADWIAFADELDPARFAVVFVPDTLRAFEKPAPGLERHVVFEAASWNVGLRMALYEAAFLNMAVMHGPLELVWYNETCRYAVFMPLGASPQSEEAFLRERGFVIGRDLPFARPWQHIIWEHDDIAAVRRTFIEMASLIDAISAEEQTGPV